MCKFTDKRWKMFDVLSQVNIFIWNLLLLYSLKVEKIRYFAQVFVISIDINGPTLYAICSLYTYLVWRCSNEISAVLRRAIITH